jgi:hypothetical protein
MDGRPRSEPVADTAGNTSGHHHADCKSALPSAQTAAADSARPLCSGQTVERVTASSDTSGTPAKPQDYAGLRAELATLANDFSPLINELWPRLEDHQYRWELHSYGLPEGYDKLVVADIIVLVIEALKGIGAAGNKLLQAHVKADRHNPSSPDARLISAPHSAVSDFPIG